MSQAKPEDFGASLPRDALDRLPPPMMLRSASAAMQEFSALSACAEDIPAPWPCYACGSQTVKAHVDYEYIYHCNDVTRVVMAKTLPGYRCPACEVSYQDPTLDAQFLRLVARVLAGFGYAQLQDDLERKDANPETYTIFTPSPFSVAERP